jgi:K+-sensing histidine kinase KdpD
MIEVNLSDTGVGIPSDQIAQVFEPFFTTKAASKGSGLGLLVCREIVKLHRGEIRVARSSTPEPAFKYSCLKRPSERSMTRVTARRWSRYERRMLRANPGG